MNSDGRLLALWKSKKEGEKRRIIIIFINIIIILVIVACHEEVAKLPAICCAW
jgi:hypothetical protein